MNTLFEQMNTNQTFIFVDGSYFNFHRYHSILTWWKNAFPEDVECLKDPYQNPQFLEKFKKTFATNIQNLQKNLKIDKLVDPIIVVGKDCKREHIWRTKLFPQYKGNRATGQEDGFMGGPFFKMVYEEKLFIEAGARYILKHPHLEADDCIALSILANKTNESIYIITSDRDYLQLNAHNVDLFNLTYKNIAEKNSTGDAHDDLEIKIIMGDTSDNIPSVFPKCGPKTALKCIEDPEFFKKKMASNSDYYKQYELNKKLVDFNNIPENLIEEFMNTIKK